MVVIKNRLNQLLTINLSDGTSLHLKAREDLPLTSERFNSPELSNHISKGNVLIMKMS